MGMHKQPQALRELHGTANRNKHRDNQDAPEPKAGIGPAPDYFDDEQSEVWDYLVSTCPPGVLGDSDRPTFEVMVILFWRFRNGEYDKDAKIPQLNGAELSRMDSLMGRYGMTPSDRQKIVIPKQEKKNPFESF